MGFCHRNLVSDGQVIKSLKNGDPDRIRTCGLQIRNLSLYPAELRGRPVPVIPEPTAHVKMLRHSGRAGRFCLPGAAIALHTPGNAIHAPETKP